MNWREIKEWFGLEGETEEEVLEEYRKFLDEIQRICRPYAFAGLVLLLPIPIALAIYALYVHFLK